MKGNVVAVEVRRWRFVRAVSADLVEAAMWNMAFEREVDLVGWWLLSRFWIRVEERREEVRHWRRWVSVRTVEVNSRC